MYNMRREKAGSDMALPFLFISFDNPQFADHLAVEDK
jgi:hypothetical protein